MPQMITTPLPLLRAAESLLLPPVSAAVQRPAAAPALNLMTDFLATAAASIEASASLGEAERRMLECGVGLLIVLDEPPCVMGVIDKHDLRGERAPWLSAQPERSPGEWRVGDLVTRLRELDVLSLTTLLTATPAQVLEALRSSGRDHLLVVEPSGTDVTGRLRGVVSRARAEQQAHAALAASSPIS
jgi:CBS domain-containing protein